MIDARLALDVWMEAVSSSFRRSRWVGRLVGGRMQRVVVLAPAVLVHGRAVGRPQWKRMHPAMRSDQGTPCCMHSPTAGMPALGDDATAR